MIRNGVIKTYNFSLFLSFDNNIVSTSHPNSLLHLVQCLLWKEWKSRQIHQWLEKQGNGINVNIWVAAFLPLP